MSKKDFAQVKAPRHEPKKKGSSLLPIVMVLLVIVSFAAGYWLAGQQLTAPEAPLVSKAELQTLQAQLEARSAQVQEQQSMIAKLKQQSALWKAKAEQDAHSKVGDLSFYHELPNQSVTPSPVMERAKAPVAGEPAPVIPDKAPAKVITPAAVVSQPATPAAVSSDHQFTIQVASLRREQDALALRQKLEKNGVQSFIRTADLGDKGQWFRVYAGPYSSRTKAEQLLPAIEARVHVKGLRVHGG